MAGYAMIIAGQNFVVSKSLRAATAHNRSVQWATVCKTVAIVCCSAVQIKTKQHYIWYDDVPIHRAQRRARRRLGEKIISQVLGAKKDEAAN
jgi:hypothetical protein